MDMPLVSIRPSVYDMGMKIKGKKSWSQFLEDLISESGIAKNLVELVEGK
jgi:predicted CopG family antitoxin